MENEGVRLATAKEIARARAAHPDRPGRSTTARFSESELTAFLAGQWVTCHVSNWVTRALWDEEAQTLWLLFEGNWLEPYKVSRATALRFAAAPSKGGFVHDYLI